MKWRYLFLSCLLLFLSVVKCNLTPASFQFTDDLMPIDLDENKNFTMTRASWTFGELFLRWMTMGSSPSLSQSVEWEFEKIRTNMMTTGPLTLYHLGQSVSWEYIGFRVFYWFGIVLSVYIFTLVIVFFSWRFGGGKAKAVKRPFKENTMELRVNLAALFLFTILTFFGIMLALTSILKFNDSLTNDDFTYKPFFQKIELFKDAWYRTSEKFLDTAAMRTGPRVEGHILNDLEGKLFETVFGAPDKIGMTPRCFSPVLDFLGEWDEIWSNKTDPLLPRFVEVVEASLGNHSWLVWKNRVLNDLYPKRVEDRAENFYRKLSETLKFNFEETLSNQDKLEFQDLERIVDHIDSPRTKNMSLQLRQCEADREDVVDLLDTAWAKMLLRNGSRISNLPLAIKEGRDLSTRIFNRFNRTFHNETRADSRLGIGLTFLILPLFITVMTIVGVFMSVSENVKAARGETKKAGHRKSDVVFMVLVILLIVALPISVFANSYVLFTSGVMEVALCKPLDRMGNIVDRGSTLMADGLFSKVVNGSITEYESEWPWLKEMQFFQSTWIKCRDQNFLDAFNVFGVRSNDSIVPKEVGQEMDAFLQHFADVYGRHLVDRFSDGLDYLIGPFEDFGFTRQIELLNDKLVTPEAMATLKKDLLADLKEADMFEIAEKQYNEFLVKLDEWNQNLTDTLQLFKDMQRAANLSGHLVIESDCKDELHQRANNGILVLLRNNTDLLNELGTNIPNSIMEESAQVDCKEMHLRAHEMSDHFCQTFVQPFNGFLYGLGLCVILYLPTMFCIFKILKINCTRSTKSEPKEKKEKKRKHEKSAKPFGTNKNESIEAVAATHKKAKKLQKHRTKKIKSSFDDSSLV